MGEEVRIVAKFDDTDIQNGVQRTERAAREMKRVWEESMAVGFPKDSGGGDSGGGGRPWNKFDFEGEGEKAGADFTRGFVGKLLIRDAIYAMISGIGTAFKTMMADLDIASGGRPDDGFFAGAGHGAAHLVRLLLPSVNASVLSQTGNENSREDSARNMERLIDQARENPSILQPTGQLEDQLSKITNQRDQNQKIYEGTREDIVKQGYGNPAELADMRATFEPQDRYFAQMEQHLRELVSLGKERDRKVSEDAKKSSEADQKGRTMIEAADDFMAGQIRKDQEGEDRKAAAAVKKAEEEARKKREHDISVQMQIDRQEESGDSGQKDLRFTEEEIRKTRATSAVVINGGVFGRSDSVGVLISHAAQTVSELRKINAELTKLRTEKSELTLL